MTISSIRNIGLAALTTFMALSGSAHAMGKKPAATGDNPIPLFLEVSPGVYRGGLPEEAGVKYLKSKGFKAIINLQSSRSKMKAEEKAAKAAGIRWISLPISLFNIPNQREVDDVLDHMNDPALRPIFIHCKAGRDRTGLFVGLHRVENEGWDPAHAFEEMLERGYRTIYFPLNNIFERRTGFDI